MLFFLPAPLRGLIAGSLLVINTLFWATPLLTLAVLKLLLPVPPLRRLLDRGLNFCATAWIRCNGLWIRLVQRERWDLQRPAGLARDGWYLVNCNHRSWVDIFVLQQAFSGHIPLLKFFLKQELIWVPVIGIAWWALDFPFMKRHSRAALRRNPALRDQDRETTRRACAKFKNTPTSVMNFAEGTRFTAAKHARQGGPYRHLLQPKAGALALALHAMGDQFQALIDVTLAYPRGTPSFWDLLCGRAGAAVLRAQLRPIPAELCVGDYDKDPAFRAHFHRWLGTLWQDKDALLDTLMPSRPATERSAAPLTPSEAPSRGAADAPPAQ